MISLETRIFPILLFFYFRLNPFFFEIKISSNAPLFNRLGTRKVGTVNEVCWRTDDVEAYRCAGTMSFRGKNRRGYLEYSGFYPSDKVGGRYTITGGTKDFKDAKGLMTSRFDESTGQSLRTIRFEQ